MTEHAAIVGRLVLEEIALEKRIGALRIEAARRATTFQRTSGLLIADPERIVLEGQDVEAQFAGQPQIDGKELDVSLLTSLLDELRAAIVRKRELLERLIEMGVDLEESERQELLKKSRALLAVKEPGSDGEKPIGFSGARRRPR